jgi:hypothetical protein
MPSPDFQAIDRQLAELGEVPAPEVLAALISRHAGERVTLRNIDALLAAIGGAPALPPRLQETVVDMPAPEHEAAPTPRERMPWESEPPAATEAAAAAAAVAVAAAPLPGGSMPTVP